MIEDQKKLRSMTADHQEDARPSPGFWGRLKEKGVKAFAVLSVAAAASCGTATIDGFPPLPDTCETGCQDSGARDSGQEEDGGHDGGSDGGPVDSGMDAGPDGGPVDSGSDGGPVDSGMDAGPDGGPVDAGPDGGPVDSGSDGGPVDSGMDAGPDADAGMDGGSDGGVVTCPGVFNSTRTGAWNVGVDVPLGGYNVRYTGPSGPNAGYEVRCQANGNPVRLGLAIATFTPTDVNVPEDSKKVQFNLTGGSATVMNGTINTANYP